MVQSLDEHTEPGETALLSPDSRWLSLANAEGLHLYSTNDWTWKYSAPGNSARWQHAWSQDSRWVAVPNHDQGVALHRVTGRGTLERARLIPSEPANVLAFVGPNQLVVACNHALSRYDAESGTVLQRFPHAPAVSMSNGRRSSLGEWFVPPESPEPPAPPALVFVSECAGNAPAGSWPRGMQWL